MDEGTETTAIPETRVSHHVASRMRDAMFGQARRTLRCPDGPDLSGRLAVVTGASGGIGVEIARGLSARGAELVLPVRSRARGERVAQRIRAQRAGVPPVHLVDLDLEDLVAARACGCTIAELAHGRAVDILVENAGIWPQRYSTTRQGHEIAFGTNVLAHYVLRDALLREGLLRDARVVVLTGDIYILQSECTPDYRWGGRLGGMLAYCRSKLGNLWIAAELQRRHPELHVSCAHPGVVATNLGGRAGAFVNAVKRRMMIGPEEGAQTPLLCATQPGISRGAYYHNTRGRVILPPEDPACDAGKAAALWQLCDSLAATSSASPGR